MLYFLFIHVKIFAITRDEKAEGKTVIHQRAWATLQDFENPPAKIIINSLKGQPSTSNQLKRKQLFAKLTTNKRWSIKNRSDSLQFLLKGEFRESKNWEVKDWDSPALLKGQSWDGQDKRNIGNGGNPWKRSHLHKIDQRLWKGIYEIFR